jgi:hypothetical protein
MLTRRHFVRGTTALAATSIRSRRGRAQAPPLRVRRSINDLIGERSPLIESYRRAVDVMMQRDITDKTSWWFQASIHGMPDEEIAQLSSLAKYWQQCPHRNYFFLSWHRMYLHFFERIVRKASGDPAFALPYWPYDQPGHGSLPTAFTPDADEFATATKPALPPLQRKNPLARARRHEYVDRRYIGLGDVAREVKAAMAVDRFAVTDTLDALQGFGGVRVAAPLDDGGAAGAIEAAPHNLVHKTLGLDGDMGSPTTAARDPIFWLHHANIDRLWMKWTDPSRGRIPPVDDEAWMNTRFTFVDEDGSDRQMTGAEVLDTQFQLGYRYDDDPVRSERLRMEVPVAVLTPGARGTPPNAFGPSTRARVEAPAAPVVLARAAALRLSAKENEVALVPVVGRSQSLTRPTPGAAQRLRIVLRNVIARDGVPPYDVLLVAKGADPQVAATTVRIGALDLFGGLGPGAHRGGKPNVAIIAFEATDALAELSRIGAFDMRDLRVLIARRSFPLVNGGAFTPDDPDPPRIGSIELLQS